MPRRTYPWQPTLSTTMAGSCSKSQRGASQSAKSVTCRDGRFGSKVGQIGPKWDKSEAFSDQIPVHLAPRAKCTEI